MGIVSSPPSFCLDLDWGFLPISIFLHWPNEPSFFLFTVFSNSRNIGSSKSDWIILSRCYMRENRVLCLFTLPKAIDTGFLLFKDDCFPSCPRFLLLALMIGPSSLFRLPIKQEYWSIRIAGFPPRAGVLKLSDSANRFPYFDAVK